MPALFNFYPFLDAAAWAAYYQYYGQQMQQPTGQPTMQPGVAPTPGMPPQPDQNQATAQQPSAGKLV